MGTDWARSSQKTLGIGAGGSWVLGTHVMVSGRKRAGTSGGHSLSTPIDSVSCGKGAPRESQSRSRVGVLEAGSKGVLPAAQQSLCPEGILPMHAHT